VRRPRLFSSPLPGLLLSAPVFEFVPVSGFASAARSNFCLPPAFPGAEFHRVVGSCDIVAWPDSLIACRGCCAQTVLKPSSRPGLVVAVDIMIFLRFCSRSHCSWVLCLAQHRPDFWLFGLVKHPDQDFGPCSISSPVPHQVSIWRLSFSLLEQ
jgi:hypothetical protein